MDVFSSRYYRLSKMFLKQLGVWPEQTGAATIVLPFIFYFACASLLVAELIRMHDSWGNIDETVQIMPSIMLLMISGIKLTNALINKTAIFELFDRIKHDWQSLSNNRSSIIILKQNAEKARVLTTTYAAVIYSATIAFCGLPTIPLVLNVVMPLNESREKKYLFLTEYKVDPTEYYYYILMHAYIVTYACVTIHIAIDSIFNIWVQHGCALFEIVGYNLRHIVEIMDVDKSNVKSMDDKAYKHFSYCIKSHKNAIMFADLIESTYSTSLAAVTASNLIIISSTSVLLVIYFNNPEEAIRYMAFTIGQAYHLYCYSVSGQKMIDYSNQITDYAYESDWSSFSPRVQKLVILIIARAQRACLLTAGKVYIMTMENFCSVVQTSFTYFTMICSFR